MTSAIILIGCAGYGRPDMLARFDETVAAEHPDLMLWQVGTNAVLRGDEHSKSDALIRDGIRRMKATGADVVLIDPQFAPKVIAKPEIEDMVDLISSAAKQENVDVFHRFALMIVALGSSSTAGAGASSAEATYPSRLMVELSHRFRTQPIMVLNRGVSGERAADMLARFDDSVATERPDLVLWQVGTNAVLQGYEHSKSDALIRDGIRRMKATGADVVLIDPQFAPKVIAKPEIEDMVDLISSAAKQENVDVFHRFALMRHWHEIDGMPFEVFVSSDGLHMNDWSYNCFAKALTDAVADAATPRPQSGTTGAKAIAREAR